MRIDLRKVGAVLLIPLFALALIGALALLRVNAALLNPAVYTETLSRINAYEFVYDAALPALLDEADIDLEGQRVGGIALSNDKVIGWAREVAPPDFLRAAPNDVASAALPYLAGRADSFEVAIPLEERGAAAVQVMSDALVNGVLYEFLFAELVEPEARRADETYLADLPSGLAPTSEEIVAALREIIDREWFDRQLRAAFDEATPYLTGRADSFSVHIPLQERAGAAQAVVARMLTERARGEFLEEAVASAIEDTVNEADALPWGLRFTSEEAREAARAIMASAWAEAAVATSVDTVAVYLTGGSDDLTVSIAIDDEGRGVIAEALGAVVDAKYRDFYERLPVCPDGASAPSLSLDATPECRPPQLTYAQAKARIGLDPVELVEDALVDAAPPSITLTKSDLLGDAADDSTLETVRGYFRDGYTFTHEDLRSLLADEVGADAADTLDDVRGWLADGVRFNETDLRDAIGAELVDSLRGILRTVALLPPFLIAAALALLFAIGYLGGRRWPDRLIWAGAAVVIAGALILLLGEVGARLAVDFTDEALRKLELNPAILAKAEEARDEVVRAYAGPLRAQGAGVLAAGLAMAAVGAGLIYAGRRSALEAPDALSAEAVADTDA